MRVLTICASAAALLSLAIASPAPGYTTEDTTPARPRAKTSKRDPAPQEYISDGGFENAVLDPTTGMYQSSGWQFLEDSSIQTTNTLDGHFSVAMVSNLDDDTAESTFMECDIQQLLPGNFYTLSFEYYVAQSNGAQNVQLRFGVGGDTIVQLGLDANGPMWPGVVNASYACSGLGDPVALNVELKSLGGASSGSFVVLLDNISLVDIPYEDEDG